MILETICVGEMQVNCYVLAEKENSQAIIIDPGAEEAKIKKTLHKYGLEPDFIINTHGHYDHIGCDDKFGVPVYIHSQDFAYLKDSRLNLSSFFSVAYSVNSKIINVEDKQIIHSQAMELEVIHTPGHTPGGISLLLKQPKNKILFTGDSLFCQGIGRTDLGGSEKLLIKSIKERLLNFSDDTVIYPGHGPSSTIGEERRSNPFL
jgi:hydroxyacylglutathione hydrolase